MINGYTPGPDLVVDEGDWVEIEVNNESVDEITIHWHGIEQRGTPWSDGVAGVTQFPIGVSSQFIYSFRATQHGFYWYHAHNRGLLGDGLRGTLYINPRPGREQPFHLIPNATVDQLVRAETESKKVLLADWSHRSSEEILTTWNATSISPLCIQSMLINGRGQQICASPATLAASGTNLTAQGCRNPTLNPANGTRPDLLDPETWFNCRNTSTPLENFVVDPASEWLALQLVNAGSEWSILFTIDEHQFWVFAADGSYIEPSLVSGITIAMGERYSIFVRLDKPSGTSYNIRIAALGQTISGYALLSYESGCNDSTRTSTSPLPTVTASSIPSISYGGAPLNATTFVRFNATYHPPYPANPPPLGPADVTLRLDYGPRGPTVWVLNNEPFSLWRELETPVLFDPTISLGANLSLPYRSGDVVDLILSASLGNPSHSIHKHGVKGWNIGFANTAFNYSSTTEAAAALPRAFNFVNPPFRDNMNTPAAFATPAWAAIRFFSDDPAPIFIHCHISLHLSAGMALVLLESIDNLPPIPTRYLEYAEEFSGQTFSSTPYVGFDSNYTSINFNASVPVNTTASFNTTS
ncbi:multicopper oxidase-domain-containing protein [Mrakia frigida]|uniref:multicopper oxidase-domain-containing protein n=1 Tax=Mrakia frigida TaxID=29902 RepID=UPI003FCBFEF1